MRSDAAQRRFVILMNGYTACLKTYTARRLGTLMRVPVLETNKLGRCTDQEGVLDLELRQRRYDLLLRQAELHLRDGGSVILDGTFGRRQWRERVYELCERSSVRDVVVVRCTCDDEEVIHIRLQDRARNPHLAEAEVCRYSSYEETRGAEESVSEDALPSGGRPAIVDFDTGTYTVTLRESGKTDLAAWVRDHIFASVHTGRLKEQ